MAKIDNSYNGSLILTYTNGDKTIFRNKTSYRTNAPGDKIHTIKDGERLDTIAYLYYGESKHWWILADANDIKDTLINPFVLITGQELLIPDLDTFENSI
tara:strand:- start:1111 stop:1410 length:300 start_codon:yes stop_codon:yes gene_type:complete